MKDEYIIINKIQLLKRIEELETKQKEFENLPYNPISTYNALQYEINIYKQILSQSIPLIPEIEKAYTKAFSEGTCFGATTIYKYETSKEYISNLKLDI